MNIGIDIDGVLIDWQSMRIKEGTAYSKEKNIIVNFDMNKPEDGGFFDWDEKTNLDFYKYSFNDYYTNSPVIETAIEVMKKLKKEGHKLYIVTARGVDKRDKEIAGIEKIMDVTKNWIEANNIPSDGILFALNGSKSKICLENNIHVLIEDAAKHIEEVSKVIPVIAYKKEYNKYLKELDSNYKIYWTDNWNEIFNIIEYRI